MSELVEPIEDINRKLKDNYGYGPDGNNPEWRVVLAGELTEKRWMTHTDDGFELLYPEVRLVPKYQHIDKHKYVLERQVPVIGETDITTKTSYEPAWTFEDRFGVYLPPIFDACKFIIDRLYMQQEKAGFMKKYDDPEATEQARLQKIIDMEKQLFGNETPVGDALAHKYGVVNKYEGDKNSPATENTETT